MRRRRASRCGAAGSVAVSSLDECRLDSSPSCFGDSPGAIGRKGPPARNEEPLARKEDIELWRDIERGGFESASGDAASDSSRWLANSSLARLRSEEKRNPDSCPLMQPVELHLFGVFHDGQRGRAKPLNDDRFTGLPSGPSASPLPSGACSPARSGSLSRRPPKKVGPVNAHGVELSFPTNEFAPLLPVLLSLECTDWNDAASDSSALGAECFGESGAGGCMSFATARRKLAGALFGQTTLTNNLAMWACRLHTKHNP